MLKPLEMQRVALPTNLESTGLEGIEEVENNWIATFDRHERVAKGHLQHTD